MDKTKRHIPSRYITYHFVCRNCGESDVGIFDKFTNPKERDDLLCNECDRVKRLDTDEEWDDEDFELPF